MDDAIRLPLIENVRAKSLPPLSNEIFGLIIESLGEDIPSLRSCSLVSPVFRHFCSPILYRDIELDCEEKLETFLQLGADSNSLIHTKSLSLTYPGSNDLTHLHNSRRILDIISQKVPLETLRLHYIEFQAEHFTESLLSKLSTIITLDLQQCSFGGFSNFASFIRCFPCCRVLRLHSCTLGQGPLYPTFSGLPTYNLAPSRLEITGSPLARNRGGLINQASIVGMPWLDLTGLKSFTHVIKNGMVKQHIATCELLEEADLGAEYFIQHHYAISQLASLMVRIRSLTLRCSPSLHPWFSKFPNTFFPSSVTLERIRIITRGPSLAVESCRILDNTFSDTDKYPSLVEFEVGSLKETTVGRKARDVYERLCYDEYFPRLRESGRLPASCNR